jgi:CRP-like cAMP-binding protein
VPVTARLSLKFYERLGDDIATELVDWFNAVDAAYRADLERLNELNFQRFDAKVEQRFAAADAKLEKRFAEADVKLEKRFAEADVKLEKRFAEADVKFEKRFAEADVKFERRFAEFDRRLEMLRADLIKWAFLFWMLTALAVLGLYFR